MVKKFEEQYPGYPFLPSNESKWKAPAVLAVTVLALIFAGYSLFKELSRLEGPVSVMAGVDQKTVLTLKNLAISQAKSGQYKSAAKNFDDYFKLGGKDEEAKRMADFVKERMRNSPEAD